MCALLCIEDGTYTRDGVLEAMALASRTTGLGLGGQVPALASDVVSLALENMYLV